MRASRTARQQRRGFYRWFTGALVLGIAAWFVVTSAPFGGGTAAAQRLTAMQPAEVNASNDPTHGYGESQVVVNPKNPNNLVLVTNRTFLTKACLAANAPECQLVTTRFGEEPRGLFKPTRAADSGILGVFVSVDRGKSWKRVTGPNLPPSGFPDLVDKGDPSLAVTSDGTFYFSFDAFVWDIPEKAIPAGGVGVSKSTDGGLTWSQPVLTGIPADGPKITSDLSTGKIYVAGTNRLGTLSTGDPNAREGTFSDRWLASSSDGVKWTAPQRWGGGGEPGFSVRGTFSAANGVLAVAFPSTEAEACKFFLSAAAPCTVFQTTTDAGASWTRHRVPAPSNATGAVAMAADPKVREHYTVAVNAAGTFNVYQTRDSGKTWTGPTTFTDDASKTHFHQWMSYSAEGIVSLMWRTNEPGQGPPFASNVWAAISKDGGSTFSQPLKISGGNSAPPAGRLTSGDDYSGIFVGREEVFVSWADWRPGERSAFFSAIKLGAFNAR